MEKRKEFRPTIMSQKRCLLLLGIIVLMFLLENLSSISFSRQSIYIYIVKPIIWIIIIFIVRVFPRIRANGKIRSNGFLRWWTGYLAAAYILCMFLGGLIEGFGKSPYDLSPEGIIKNAVIVGTMLVGKELIRGYLVNSVAGKRPNLTIGIFAVFMTLLSLSVYKIEGLKTGFDYIQYVGEYFLPELSKNIIATYLIYIGGPILSIIYMAVVQGTIWFLPVLPDLSWITKALIGTLCPIFSLMFIQYMYSKQLRLPGYGSCERENPMGWIITSIISISLVWFGLGVFPLKPSVIATGSMKPLIQPGDMVLVRKVMKIEDLKVGDIIQFRRDNIFIFHRIIDIKEINRETRIQTKGDNNSGADNELVNPEDVKGKVAYIIPKIGWPTLLLKSEKDVPKEEVEF